MNEFNLHTFGWQPDGERNKPKTLLHKKQEVMVFLGNSTRENWLPFLSNKQNKAAHKLFGHEYTCTSLNEWGLSQNNIADHFYFNLKLNYAGEQEMADEKGSIGSPRKTCVKS